MPKNKHKNKVNGEFICRGIKIFGNLVKFDLYDGSIILNYLIRSLGRRVRYYPQNPFRTVTRRIACHYLTMVFSKKQ